jgi:soluble lytic murein transglycosylase-like protein
LPGSNLRLHRLHSRCVTVVEGIGLIWAELFMILERQRTLPLAAYLAFAASCFAGESAVLSTGFRLHADRHETDGSVVRLYANGGVTEFPAAQIARFEADEEVAKPSAWQASAPPTAEELVTAAANRNGLPADFVRSVVAAESGFRTNAVSNKGAIGLMQLMPATAREYGANPHDPQQNVEAGTQYLRDLLWKYRNDPHQVSHALAAYNAGPGAVDRYHGIPPYRETLAYVERVLRKYAKQTVASKRSRPPAD